MASKYLRTGLVILLVFFLTIIALPAAARGENRTAVRIGTLANNGKPAAIKTWQPLMDYLEKSLPEHEFVLVPLDFDELYPAVEAAEVDFIITNTGQYIELESYYGVSRVATFRNAGPGGFYTKFGGVLFVRADNNDIHTISDFPGHKILVADEKSFGGWLMQLREIREQGIDPARFADFKSTGSHEEVVYAVLKGDSDIGAVRTDILERMAAEAKIDLDSFRIINEQFDSSFPYRRSTRLYPEWPFAKIASTDSWLAQKVAVALLTLPEDSPAARAALGGGWTIPEDYSKVHALFQELKIGPYQHLGEFKAADVVKKYWPVVLLSVLLLIVTAAAALRITVINRRLKATLADLNNSHAELEKANTQVVEGMQYARIIQESLLPDPRILEGVVSDLAVLWEPLDLVGGDFYFMGRVNGKVCLIVADCTGDGVPGALVTMVLSASLDSIFYEKKLTDPGCILKEVDKTVRRRLRQDRPGSTSDDGLEAAVCVYDPGTKLLKYAGAGLPLLWVKNGKPSFLRGDRAYLGYRTLPPKNPFKVRELTAKPGMTFYMFTDGITNQIGGEPRRLFGRKRLAKLIAFLSQRPLKEQVSAVKDELQSYRRGEEPRDDMTLLGFQFKN